MLFYRPYAEAKAGYHHYHEDAVPKLNNDLHEQGNTYAFNQVFHFSTSFLLYFNQYILYMVRYEKL